MASGKWQKKTLIDLYVAREKEAWYFRALAILTAALILLGFLVFAQAFPTTTTNASTLTIVAAVLLALGYSLSVALWFICRSWLFQLDVIFVPSLFSCILGTLNAGITIGATSQQWTSTSIAAIGLGAASSIVYAAIALFIFRKIQRVRGLDQITMRKQGSSEALTLLPEEEMQRQNLLRLLGRKEENRSPQQTYRIGIPDNTIALRTPPPLTGPFEGLGLSGTLHRSDGIASEYAARNNSHNTSTGALSFDNRFDYQHGNISELNANSQRAALEAARERARIAQAQEARGAPSSPRDENDTLPYPPVIINSRNQYADDISEIPLSERHPLERQQYIPGRASKDKTELYDAPGIYRSDEDFGGHDYEAQKEEYDHEERGEPRFEMVEGENIHIDLSKSYVRQRSSESYNPALHSIPGHSYTPPGRESHRRSPSSR